MVSKSKKKTDFQGGVFAQLGLHKAVKEGRKPCKVYVDGCVPLISALLQVEDMT